MLDGLDFVRQPGAFEVSYRASAEPQELTFEVETAERATRRSGPVVLRKILDMINFGAAGGHHFAPELCSAERLSGPWDGDDAFGPSYHWTLRVKSVAPEFLRLAVEHLRRCGWDKPVTSMRIRGALTPDETALSVRTAEMQRWLADPATYPHAFATERFPIHTSESTGVLYRVAFAAPLSDAQTELLQAMCARWLAATATLADHDGNPLVRTPEVLEQMLPLFETGSESFSARMHKFGHAAAPSAALLLNMLSRFHATQSRIFSVELALEGLHSPHLAVSAQRKEVPSPAPASAKGTRSAGARKTPSAGAKKAAVRLELAKNKRVKGKTTAKAASKKPAKKKPASKKPTAKKNKPAQYKSAPRRLSKKASARSSRSAKTRSKRPSSPKASR